MSNKYGIVINYLKMFLFVFSCVFLSAKCQNMDKDVIDTIALVVPSNYHGNIIIFYEQQYEKGKVEYKNGKHYVYTPEDGIIFTKYKLGEGYIEYYDENGSMISRNHTINPQKLEDNKYYIIGGRYSGFYLDDKDSIHVRYSVFDAGLGSELKKESSYLDDKEIREIYENTRKRLANDE